MNLDKYTYNYFLFLFSIIPLTIVAGSAVSFINILLIDLSFIILLVYKKNFYFLKNKTIIYFFVLYIYLIFNSFISIDYSESILRNLGFIRMIILFVAFNYFYHQNFFISKMFKSWTVIISIVIFDVLVEYFLGRNLLGYKYGELYGGRVVSFFKDEPIVGSFLNGFFLILAGFLINQKKKYRNYVFLLIFIMLITIFITGERSSSLKALLGISVFFLFYKEINLKNKTLFFFVILVIIFAITSNSSSLKERFTKQVIDQKSQYFNLYHSGFQVYKNNKLFGVGNKNYRVETCRQNQISPSKNKDRYICTTHPHQIYFELLSEHGLIGTVIILLIFYKLIFSKIKRVLMDENYLKIGLLIYLLLSFLPVIPSGAFFGTFVLTLFTINLSLFYASDKNMNVFKTK